MRQKIILGKLPVKLILIIFLFPLQLFSQDISGVWTGSMYNDTTRQTIHYELAVDESKGKGSGFSHTTFVIDHVKNIGVKAVKVKMKNNHVYVVDDKFVFNNYSEPPAEGVRMYSFLTLSHNDSADILSGIWRTNATKYFRPLTGTVFLEKKKKQKPEKTIIVAKLIELGLADQLAFLPPGLASRNMVAMNNPSDRQKSAIPPNQEDWRIQQQNSQIAGGRKNESPVNEAEKAATGAASPVTASNQPASENAGPIPVEKAHESASGSKNQKVELENGNSIHAEEEVISAAGHTPSGLKNQKAREEGNLTKGKDLKTAQGDEQVASDKTASSSVEKTNGNPTGKPGNEKATEGDMAKGKDRKLAPTTVEKTNESKPGNEKATEAGNLTKGKDLKASKEDEQVASDKTASSSVEKTNGNPTGKPGNEKATEGDMAKGKDLKLAPTTVEKTNESKPGNEKAKEARNMAKEKELKPTEGDQQIASAKTAPASVEKTNGNSTGKPGNEKATDASKPVEGNRVQTVTSDEGISSATPADRSAEKKTGISGDSRANTKLEKENKTSGNGEKTALGKEGNGNGQVTDIKNETASVVPANKSGTTIGIKAENTNDKKTTAKEQNNPASTPVVKNKMTAPPPAAQIALRKIETIRTVEITQDSVVFSLYDNGAVDGDTVSVLLNGKVIMPRVGLLAKAISKTVHLTPEMGDSISVIMYAENLGSIPPNTGLLVIREATRIYEIRFSGDLNKNSKILLLRKKKN